MSRIPDEEIPRLKKEVPLADLCRAHGIELKSHGKDLMGRCPFHDDQTPSFIVTPSKNLWHCMGACNKGGSNIDFVMLMKKTDFRGAIEILRQHRGAASPATFTTRLGTERAVLADPSRGHSDAELLARVVDFYQQTFMDQPSAMQYLQQRNCFHPEAVTRFKIGFANRRLGYRIPMTTVGGQRLKEQLTRLGVFRPVREDGKGGHEHFRGCVVFPIFGEAGQVVGMYGRRCGKLMPGAPKHLYLPGPHAGVWNSDELQKSRHWLLCEAAMDALSLWSHGFRNVTWSYGVNGFSPDHWKLLRRCKPDRVTICYDNDEAGNRAANELAQQLEPESIEAWRVELKPHTDLNDLVRGPSFNRPRDYNPKNELASLLAAAVRLLPDAAPRAKPVVLSTTETTEATKEEKNPFPLAASGPLSDPAPAVETPVNAGAFCVSKDGKQASFAAGERSWRVRGLENNTSFDHLKINLRVQYRDRFHLDTFDLYNARARCAFVVAAHEITGADKAALESDLGQLISQLETHQDRRVLAALKIENKAPLMTPEGEGAALKILHDPRMLDRVLQDLHRCGLVGEDTNLLVAWLVSVSRKLEKPLGVCVMSRSAAGKSSLLDAVAGFVPEEDRHQYTALTPQALFHMKEDELRHKALFVAEDVGVEGASYSLKTIQSDGKLIMACTTKDETTGQMITRTKVVHGPVAVFLTSTSRALDDELLNRLLVLTIDEGSEQTQAIHEAQRHAQTLEGVMERRARPGILKLQQNVQRLIRPLVVRNPLARELHFGHGRLRSRRDHQKYLDLINVMALAHQYQREIKIATDLEGQSFQYIEVIREDVQRVDELMKRVLEQTTDELAPASRRMLSILRQWNGELPLANGRFHAWTRREIRERTNWSDTQVRMVLSQLVDFEFLLQMGQGGRGNLVRYQLADSYGIVDEEVRRVRTSSQSQNCELPARASSLVAAALAANGESSHRSQGVHVVGVVPVGAS